MKLSAHDAIDAALRCIEPMTFRFEFHRHLDGVVDQETRIQAFGVRWDVDSVVHAGLGHDMNGECAMRDALEEKP